LVGVAFEQGLQLGQTLALGQRVLIKFLTILLYDWQSLSPYQKCKQEATAEG
jgi:hypothetical protein